MKGPVVIVALGVLCANTSYGQPQPLVPYEPPDLKIPADEHFGELTARFLWVQQMEVAGEVVTGYRNIRMRLSYQDRPLWKMRCTSDSDSGIDPTYRWSCSYTSLQSDLAPMSIALVGDDPDRMKGMLTVGDSLESLSVFEIEHDGTWWRLSEADSGPKPALAPAVATSSTATIAQWQLPSFHAEVRPHSVVTERLVEALAAASLETKTFLPRRPVGDTRIPLRSGGFSDKEKSTSAEKNHVEALLNRRRPDLAIALASLWGEPVVGQPDQARASYFEPTHFGFFFSFGVTSLIPVNSGPVKRKTTSFFLPEAGLDLGNRIQFLVRLGLGGRPFLHIESTDLNGDFSKTRANSASLLALGGLRYILGDWSWRPFAGILLGLRGGSQTFRNEDTRAQIKVSHRGLIVGPHVGLQRELITTPGIGVALKFEGALSMSFIDKPKLEGANPMERQQLRAVSFGEPALDISISMQIEFRFKFNDRLLNSDVRFVRANARSRPASTPPP